MEPYYKSCPENMESEQKIIYNKKRLKRDVKWEP